MHLFTITCSTCQARLKVRDLEAIGQILACPKCRSMVHVEAPAEWTRPSETEAAAPQESVPADSEVAASQPQKELAAPASSAARVACRKWGPIFAAATLAVAAALVVRASLKSDHPPDRSARTSNAADQPAAPQAVDQPAASAATRDLPPSSASIRHEPASSPATEETAPATPLPHPADSAGPESDSAASAAPIAAVPAADSERASSADDPAGVESRPESPPAENPGNVARNEAPADTTGGNAARPDKPARQPQSSTAPTVAAPTASTAAAQLIVGPNDDADADAPDGEAKAPISAAQIEQRLELRLPRIDADRLSLADLSELLYELLAAPVWLDLSGLESAGISPAAKNVSLHAKDTTVGELLDEALAPLGLTARAADGCLQVTLSGPSWEAVVHPIGDLLKSSGPTADPALAARELSELITRFIAPDTWAACGGKGTMDVKDSELTVTQSPAVQSEVRNFLDRLRAARGLPIQTPGTGNSEQLALRRTSPDDRLKQPVTFTFVEPTELTEIVRHWRELSGLAIVANWPSLRAANIAPESKIACSAIDAPFGEALSSILEPLGIAWRAVDAETLELIEIGAAARHMEVEFHRAELSAQSAKVAAADPIAKLKNATGAGLWSEREGGGAMAWDAPSRHLIVRHTRGVQTQIAELLASER